ncbi:metal-dependent hydrolase family protein [Winogradskyella aurantia]|uniref:Hydrolase n=1 Tax=Winogradskyella aurantia TaxID=1915063 RepID=A0A265UX03_9FLAO|nr:amidohydrolase family protein [Winogradskyella aurantia]OZV69845.1 hydrolase [Winogradskyella aurantia]
MSKFKNNNVKQSIKDLIVTAIYTLVFHGVIMAQSSQSNTIIFENVNIFDGKTSKLIPNQNVLVEGNRILAISSTAFKNKAAARVIKGEGKTLMPGLIDVHVHMVFGALTTEELTSPTLNKETIMEKTALQAEKMLLRGFTAVRDMGGPSFALKTAIDKGVVKGPRIWPSGAMISQTSGHGDLRMPDEKSRRFFGKPSRAELLGASFIADGRDEVLTAARENLRFGASQIKLMAGGGTSSAYDPVDVTQYTFDEMKAGVDAAEDWGTYVAVHAYTSRAIKRAVEAGVKCVEHGQLLDKATLRLIKRKGVWLSSQNLIEDTPGMDSLRRAKRKPVIEGQQKLWPMAKEMKVKLAWGTDFLFEPWLNEEQNAYMLKLKKWFTPYEILKMVTHDNAQLLALSGLRSPYKGTLGVVEENALADLILVDGNPLENIELIAQPAERFLVIMKDGEIIKNILP